MKRPRTPPTRHSGVTLIELMISMVLGLLIVIAIINVYLGSSRAAQVADAQARMNDDAEAVLLLLSSHLRMAGNNPERPFRAASSARNPVYAGPGATAFQILACDGGFSNVDSAARIDDLTCPAPSPAAPDGFAITYEADVFNTAGNEGSPVPRDCVGRPLQPTPATADIYDPLTNVATATAIQYYVAESRFYLAQGSDGVPRLMCKGNGTGSQAGVLAENIENIQLTLGLSPPAGSGNVAGFLSASEVDTDPALVGLTPADRWAKVVAVRICLVMRSAQPVVHDAQSARYFNCDGVLVDAPDTRLRRAYRKTVVLRGRA